MDSALAKLERSLAGVWPLLPENGRVFAAVSGGLDSVFLLAALKKYIEGPEARRELHVVHVNHGLRGEESEGDEAFVRALCEQYALPFHSFRVDWADARPTQALARAKREEFFRALLKAEDRLFLAHHQGDQAETVLLRLTRGSGVRGLAGMRVESGQKLRPLLHLSRAEIEGLAREWKLKWREDSSNRSLKYERNFIRHEILPKLEARRPGVAARLAALADEAASLRPAVKSFSRFSLGEDWRFYRAPELKRAGRGDLSLEFSLSRQHTTGLEALLQKSSGAYSAENCNFRLSAGLLLAARRPFTAMSGLVEARAEARMENPLGLWRMALGEGERMGPASLLGLGDKAKKELQRHRVPVFFREWVPLFVSEGRPRALLVADHPALHLELSPLGKWWLAASESTASRASGDPDGI